MKQITVVAENRPGLLAEISQALASEKININDVDAEGYDKFAIIILQVDQYDQALQIINQQLGLKALTEDVILVKLKDEPGALAHLARRFSDAGIDIRSIRIVQRGKDESIVAICTERTQEAMQLIEDILVS